VVIHNGLDESVIRGASLPARWSGEPRLLAITSRDPHKDNATLIRCLAELASRRREVAWSLRVAGTEGLPAERRLAAELGVADRIQWLGFVGTRELDSLLRESLCMVFCSVLEGFGNPTVEAMARRCPVVASRATAIPEIVGDAALLVEPGDPGAFAAGVLRLVDDAALRDELVQRGLGRIKQFRWLRHAEELLRLIDGLATPGRVQCAG
jgi:glycosyltransferase involved in cell wall biosynthesis